MIYFWLCPVSPRIETTVSGSGQSYQVTLCSTELARNVYVSVGNLEARFSDNYFDLLPGEPVTITIKSEGTLVQIKQALKVTSLMDSFVNHRQ